MVVFNMRRVGWGWLGLMNSGVTSHMTLTFLLRFSKLLRMIDFLTNKPSSIVTQYWSIVGTEL